MEDTRLDVEAKKAVLRSFTYGLYAVSARSEDDRGIFTANWVSQASFDPPMLMISIERSSSTLPLIRQSGRFAVAPYLSDSRELAGNLGRPKAKIGDKFESLELSAVETETGDIVPAKSIGYVVCKVVSEVAAGDSMVVVGEVIEAAELEGGEPLTMKAAGFRHFG